VIRVLAFDQAPNNTGWAFSTDEEEARPVWGTITMSDYGDDDQRMMLDFGKALRPLFEKYQPTHTFFEQIVIDHRHVHTPTLYRQFSVACTIQFVAAEFRVPSELVEIAPWRKRFLGRANMPKTAGKKGEGRPWLKQAAMIECARRGCLVRNDHEAEAIGILDYGLACVSRAYHFRTKGDAERRRLAATRQDMEK
jgi:hypothetical protein